MNIGFLIVVVAVILLGFIVWLDHGKDIKRKNRRG